MRALGRTTTAAVTAGAAVALLAAPAAAAPPHETVLLDCGDVQYEVRVAPGRWAPGIVVGTGQVLLPLSFGETTGTAYDADDEPLGVLFTEPGGARGGAPKALSTVSCSFSFTVPADEMVLEAEPDAAYLLIEGSVVAAVTPSGR